MPVWGVLITVASIGVCIAAALQSIDLSIFLALPSRVVGLLETDLLQALPLFVFMGALLNRLPLARILFRAALALFGGGSTGAPPAVLALGAVLGPMNGSVSANAIALTRSIEPELIDRGVPPAESIALLSVASTLGVLVPPSLVLILLGDAMMAAHTIAANATGRAARIINTQDVFRGALLPAALFLALCLGICIASGMVSRRTVREREKLSRAHAVLAIVTLGSIGTLLAGVATGYFYAVEAAAMGAVGLLLAGWLSGQLDGARLRAALDDTIATTGALFALLLAATTFTLVFRVLGSDKLVASWMDAVPGGATGIVLAGLCVIALAAFVLDAFEIIFVLIPIIMPPVLMRAEDATWVAVLTLLILQTSFLLPPLGYALTMTRSASTRHAPLRAIVRSLTPFVVAQMIVVVAVALVPALAHLGQSAPVAAASQAASPDELRRRLDQIPAPPTDLPDLGTLKITP